MTETQYSMTDALRSDHDAITAWLNDGSATEHTKEAVALREQVVINLVRHFVAEEQYLYPEVRHQLEHGDDLAELNFTADRAIEAKLKELEDPDLTPQRLVGVWSEVREGFAAHTARQDGLFSALESAVSPERLVHLADEVLGAEQLAPTRPRSIAPSSARANKVASLIEGYVDHVRDHYSHRGDDPDMVAQDD